MPDNSAHMERLKAGMSGDLNDVPGYDPTSLEKAAAKFELDPADPSQLLLLARLLADLQFGERRPGAVKGVKTTWDKRKKFELIRAYTEERARHPDYTDSEIAVLISTREEFKEFKDPDTIRKKLPEIMKFGLSDDFDVWKGVWED
jgi:hypothetical protein